MILASIGKRFFVKKAITIDQRIKVTKEILEGIRLIKIYAWESAFIKLTQTLRSQELKHLFLTKLT
jgi:ATP-binding cassette subfamily C (CFTR/MRP) protein 4